MIYISRRKSCKSASQSVRFLPSRRRRGAIYHEISIFKNDLRRQIRTIITLGFTRLEWSWRWMLLYWKIEDERVRHVLFHMKDLIFDPMHVCCDLGPGGLKPWKVQIEQYKMLQKLSFTYLQFAISVDRLSRSLLSMLRGQSHQFYEGVI